MAQSKVIAGDYMGHGVIVDGVELAIVIKQTFTSCEKLTLNKSTVLEYEVLDQKTRKSASSAVGRAFVGSVVLGPAGLFAGLSAKSKNAGAQVAVQFRNGKKSLLELNQKDYNRLIKTLF